MTLTVIDLPPIHSSPIERVFVNLHGWGANGADLAPLATVFELPACRYFFPDAPYNHPEVPNGKAWYALETKQYEGLTASRQELKDWLLSIPDLTGISLEKTILAGFSQGGAMALDVGLGLPLAGLICLSGYLHFTPENPESKPLPPILMIHGQQDLVVPIAAAQFAKECLRAVGAKVDYHEFAMGHEIPMDIIPLIRQFVLENTP
jgi:phospholipase/carboxylesterase